MAHQRTVYLNAPLDKAFSLCQAMIKKKGYHITRAQASNLLEAKWTSNASEKGFGGQAHDLTVRFVKEGPQLRVDFSFAFPFLAKSSKTIKASMDGDALVRGFQDRLIDKYSASMDDRFGSTSKDLSGGRKKKKRVSSANDGALTCPNCSAKVSPGFATCPGCGAPMDAVGVDVTTRAPSAQSAPPPVGQCPNCHMYLGTPCNFCPGCGIPLQPPPPQWGYYPPPVHAGFAPYPGQGPVYPQAPPPHGVPEHPPGGKMPCPSCQRPVSPGYSACPFCGASMN